MFKLHDIVRVNSDAPAFANQIGYVDRRPNKTTAKVMFQIPATDKRDMTAQPHTVPIKHLSAFPVIPMTADDNEEIKPLGRYLFDNGYGHPIRVIVPTKIIPWFWPGEEGLSFEVFALILNHNKEDDGPFPFNPKSIYASLSALHAAHDKAIRKEIAEKKAEIEKLGKEIGKVRLNVADRNFPYSLGPYLQRLYDRAQK